MRSGYTAIHPLKVLSRTINGTTQIRCVCNTDMQELNGRRRLLALSTAGLQSKNQDRGSFRRLPTSGYRGIFPDDAIVRKKRRLSSEEGIALGRIDRD